MNTQNNIIWIGVDVSKKEFEIHTYDLALKLNSSIPNSKSSINKLISKFKNRPDVQVVFEATGGYEKLLLTLLQSEGIAASRTYAKSLSTLLKARIQYLEKHIKKTTQKVIALKDKSPELHQAVELLTTTKGGGDNSALSLIVAMPELGILTNKQASSLAGLAPFNRESGSMRGQREIYGGRKEMRQAIYMASLTGTRYNDVLKKFYQGLLARGESKKLALTKGRRKERLDDKGLVTWRW